MKHIMEKTICLLMCAILAFGVLCVPAAAAGYALGDVDNSGKVDTKDARLALRAAIGLDTLTAEQTAAADVDGSGKVATDDARTILRVAVGLMRLSKDGKRFEDIPTAGDLLLAFIETEGEFSPEGNCSFYGYEYDDGGMIVLAYYYDQKLPFEVYCYQPGEGFEIECAMQFNKSFSMYEAYGYVFDADYLYAEGHYTVNDTANLNPNTGASCFVEKSYEGDPELQKELPQAMTMLLCSAFKVFLTDLADAGVAVTKEDMHLNRVTESVMVH